MDNKENLEYTINKLNEIIELVGNINLSKDFKAKYELKKLHKSYDLLIALRKKLQKRLDKLEDEENV